MARNVKPGITFYRMDSGHIINKKIRLLFNECGSDGYYIWSCIIDFAYKEFGYYFDLNDEENLELFADEYCKKDLALIKKVIQVCIKRNLFNAEIAAVENVLTSVMMQEIFIHASSERRKKGSAFEIPEFLWMLDRNNLPLNIRLLTGGVQLTPGRNPQILHNRPNTETLELFGPATAGQRDNSLKNFDKEKGSGGQDARRQKNVPIPPKSFKDVEDYFLQQYNPKNPGTWFPDTCRRHALDFFDYYEANGWVQANDQKPIQKWMSAANKWIRNARTGKYSNPAGSAASPAPQKKVVATASARTSATNEISRDINFLYNKFQDSPELVTYQNIEMAMCEHLRQKKVFPFTDEEITGIHGMAVKELSKNKIESTEALIKAYMKRIAVIELFKIYNTAGATEIIKL